MSLPPTPADTREDRLDAVLADLLAADATDPAARDRILAHHPDLADELRRFLSDHDALKADAGTVVWDRTDPAVPCVAGDTPPPRRFGNYELLGELARGGMGVVWRARQLRPERIVALKMLRAGTLASNEEVERFRAEADACACLDHPGIVPIFEAGECAVEGGESRWFYSMPLIDGADLEELTAAGPAEPRTAARLLADAADAVHHAHGCGVIHRDLKPANILVEQATGAVKVTDFGLAKRVDLAGDESGGGSGGRPVTKTGQILGTPAYMAPEQASGDSKSVGPRTDVYGLGAVLYHLIVGHPPFRGRTLVDTLRAAIDATPQSPRVANRSVPQSLEAVCLRCLRKEPGERYASAADLADDLRRFLADEPVRAGGIGLTSHLTHALRASRHEGRLQSWADTMLWFAAIVTAAHALIWGLTLADIPFVWAQYLPGAVMVAGLVAVLWTTRDHGVLPTDSVERPIWAVWVGYLVARGLVGVLAWYEGWGVGPTYAVAAALAGMGFFMIGGHAWGGCYLLAAAFFTASIPLAAFPAAAVPVFGLLWGLSLTVLGLRYRRLRTGS